MKQRVLFVGIYNAARSQMAEAFLNAAFPARFEAQSAGIERGRLDPLVVEAMREVGIDISQRQTKTVFELIKHDEHFDCVITVCDEISAEHYPIIPADTERLHWGFADPSSYQGPPEEKLAFVRHIRDEIRDQINSWCAEQRECLIEA